MASAQGSGLVGPAAPECPFECVGWGACAGTCPIGGQRSQRLEMKMQAWVCLGASGCTTTKQEGGGWRRPACACHATKAWALGST